MVASADNLIAMMRAAGQGRAGGLRLGHNSSVSAGNLRATLMNWQEAHPDVEVECVEADRCVLIAGLDTGEVDITILMGAAEHNGFRCEPLWSERMLVALPAPHPLAPSDVIHWTDLRNERFVLPAADPRPEMRDIAARHRASAGNRRRQRADTRFANIKRGARDTVFHGAPRRSATGRGRMPRWLGAGWRMRHCRGSDH